MRGTTRGDMLFTMKLTICSLLLCGMPLWAQFDVGPGEVPYVPTPNEVVEAMLKLGGIKSTDVVYDLGCGDGRIVIMAAQKFGARGVGVDIDPQRIKEANENARGAKVADKVKFVEKDLFEADFREASLVTLYLLPDVNLRLRPKLLRELKTGSRIVSHAFHMDEWTPDQKETVNGKVIYLWHVTAKAKAEFGGNALPQKH